MKKTTVITEGENDRLLLQALLDAMPEDINVNFIAAGGWSSVDSLARSLLVHNEQHIAVVVDADTNDPNLIEERKRFLRGSLGVMAPSSHWHVLVIAPEIESLVFSDREVVEGIVGHAISDTEFVQGQYEPKKTLGLLLHRASLTESYQDKLPRINLESVRKLPEIASLRSFLLGVSGKRRVALAP